MVLIRLKQTLFVTLLVSTVCFLPVLDINLNEVHARCSDISFAQHILTPPTGVEGAFSVDVIDLDQDNDMDILAGSVGFVPSEVGWFENNGNAEFTYRVISNTQSGNRYLDAADVDSDGDIDVISPSTHDDTIAWYENDGDENFTQRIIHDTSGYPFTVFATDLNGDTYVDILYGLSVDHEFGWYENDGDENFTKHVLGSANLPRNVLAADIDRDGDQDVFGTSTFDKTVRMYVNNGDESFTEQIISDRANGAFGVHVADVDKDGHLDILSASTTNHEVAWYKHDGSLGFTENVISNTANGARAVSVVDVDSDGDNDVLAGLYYAGQLVWYENDGAQNFEEHVVASNTEDVLSVDAGDLDGDGDIDLLHQSIENHRFYWYKQGCNDPDPKYETHSNNDADFSQITAVANLLTSNLALTTPTLIAQSQRLLSSLKTPIITATPNTDIALTTKVPDADRAQRVILRAFGDTYTLKPIQDTATYQFTGKIPDTEGTYPYTLTINYGSTTLSEKGVFQVGTSEEATTLPKLNSTFRTAFDRDPTFTEWSYWAGRIIAGDKPTIPELLGAMEWHAAQ